MMRRWKETLETWCLALAYVLVVSWIVRPVHPKVRRGIFHWLWTSVRRRRTPREVTLCDSCENGHHIHDDECRCITVWCQCTQDHIHPHLDVTI